MTNPDELKTQIIEYLMNVRDPITSIDVVRMRIIKILEVDDDGKVYLVIKPTSNVCPMVAKLTSTIKTVVEDISGVSRVEMEIINHKDADLLNQLLNE